MTAEPAADAALSIPDQQVIDIMDNFPIPAPAFDGQSRTVAAGNAFEWLKQGWAMFVALRPVAGDQRK
ncbi:MAG: hypothetical protein ABI478_01970 [Propionivibrio sp.]